MTKGDERCALCGAGIAYNFSSTKTKTAARAVGPSDSDLNVDRTSSHTSTAVAATSGLAIASMVLGIIGGAILSIIFGFVALSQIKKRNLRGRGMAIAGVVLGFVWSVIYVVIFVVSFVFVSHNLTKSYNDGYTYGYRYATEVGQCNFYLNGAYGDFQSQWESGCVAGFYASYN